MTLDVLKWKNRQTDLEVEAVQFKAENGHELVRWTGGDAQFLVTGRINEDREFEYGYSLTLPHQQIATPGDFVIKGLEDVFWVTNAQVLFQTYDQVFGKPTLISIDGGPPRPGNIMFSRPGTPPEDFMLRAQIMRSNSHLKDLRRSGRSN